jgi:long-chain acyl-CoA synthetase
VVRWHLWDPWRTAAVRPSRPAIVTGDDCCTFAELVARAEQFGSGIARLGVREGELFATDIPSGPDLFALVLAALRGGYGVLPLSRDRDAQARDGLLRKSGAVIEVTASAREGGAVPCVTAGDVARAASGPGLPASRAGYLAFTTSGTTGSPAVVLRGRPSYSYRGVAVIGEYHAGLESGAHVMADPRFHLGTLGLGLYALQAGSPLVIAQQWSPGHFRELVDRHRADTAFVGPAQLGNLAEEGGVPGHALRVLFHAGSSTPPDVKRRAIGLFGPVLHEFYGTSQGIACQISAREWLSHPGSVGRAIPGVSISVRNGDAEAAPGQIGRIRLRYRAVDTGAAAPAYEDTGDLGFVDEAGYLHVVGRSGPDGLQQPALLEHLVRQRDGVTDVAVIASPGDPGAATCYLEYSGADAPMAAGQIAELARGLGIAKIAVNAGPSGSFARTASGKLSRVPAACQDKPPAPDPDDQQAGHSARQTRQGS